MSNDNKNPYTVTLTKRTTYDFDNKTDMLGFVATVSARGLSSVEITTNTNGGADE